MELLQTITQWIAAAAIAYGGFNIFQGATEIARNRRRGQPSMSEEWWTIIEGIIWAAFGASGIAWTLLSSISS